MGNKWCVKKTEDVYLPSEYIKNSDEKAKKENPAPPQPHKLVVIVKGVIKEKQPEIATEVLLQTFFLTYLNCYKIQVNYSKIRRI